MQKPTFNVPLKIIKKTDWNMELENGDSYKFIAMSLPKGWEEGDVVKTEDNYKGEESEIMFRVHNINARKNARKTPIIKAAFTGNKLTKNISPNGKKMPILETKLQIDSIKDGIIKLKNGDKYKNIASLTKAMTRTDINLWKPDEFVYVSKSDTLKESTYKMDNLKVGNFAYIQFLEEE